MPDALIPREAAEELRLAHFELEDIQRLAHKILQRAAEQAKRKLMAAEQQAQSIEQAAYDSGFAKGEAEGRQKGEADGRLAGEKAAREEFASRTRGAAEALEKILAEVRERRIALHSEAEAGLLRLSLEIARHILRSEIKANAEALKPLVREAIRLAISRRDLVLRLHPADIAAIQEEIPALRAAFLDLQAVRLEADSSLERGSVIAVSAEGEVDLRLSAQLAAIERALLGG
ncbi:MAG: FliH/SctL family protein [Planctomycetota bacterium]|nr:FliH/SctL family protein [Planctomycetota bacterium]